MMQRNLPLWSFLVLAACNGSGGIGGEPQPTEAALATGVRVTEVAVYQSLKSTIMKDGAMVQPTLPIVAGREALVRVFLGTDPEWQPREVVVHLLLNDGASLEQRFTPYAPSTDKDLASSVNFELTAEQVTTTQVYAVELREASLDATGPGSADGARFPVEGAAPFGASDTGEALLVTVIPIRYDADGSGRLPDTSLPQLERLRQTMYNLYPVKKVEITVGDIMPWASTVAPSGSGWGRLLNAVVRKRQSDRVPPNVYYYGMFAPAQSMGNFCGGGGCVAGLSGVSDNPNDTYVRASIGLGFSGAYSDAAGTFVHEVGHGHGRLHAPCGVGQDADRDYPHTNAVIGTWGFDWKAKTLLDPKGKVKDMMSYCNPIWVSDYTWAALFERVTYVNAQAAYELPPPNTPAAWRSYVVDEEGITGGDRVEPVGIPRGERRAVEQLSSDGRVTATVEGQFFPFDHLPGGLLLVPDDAPAATRLRLR